ncbi:hypothetical protein [Flavobacterium luteolum]|uniref:hypothetical protein n=1 Tax=Flavobacterium luteolum TaxID=3003259 RepID=UPI00248D9A61|nr:hypothetical protein [Flavobacterium luteolum]
MFGKSNITMHIHPNSSVQNVQIKSLILIAEKFAQAATKNVSGATGLQLSFDCNSKTLSPLNQMDGNVLHNEMLSDLINQVFDFESQYSDDRDQYLIPLLKYIKEVMFQDVDAIPVMKILFKNLYVADFFEDDISAKFFKDKLNLYLQEL